MSIATRTGDRGTTGLLHGQRVPKDHPQIEALGAFDELNVEVGAARMLLDDPRARAFLGGVQAALIALMGEVACAEADAGRHARSRFRRLRAADLRRLDARLAALEAKGPKAGGWAAPGANPVSLAFERARVAARRAERRLAALRTHGRHVRPVLPKWINRLSDLLWMLAREAESAER